MSTDVVIDMPVRIAGRSSGTDARYAVHDPYTEEVIAQVADAGPDEVSAAVDAAREAQPIWAAMPLDARRRALGIAADHLADRRAELIAMAIRDTGARVAVAESMQVGAAISRLREWAGRDESVLAVPGPAPVGGQSGRVRRIPVGIVACISPYNFPLLAMMGKVAPALFAGNAAILKPAPQDPLLTYELTLALEAGLAGVGAPLGLVSHLTGAGADPGSSLVDHPDVAAVSFTGSTVVGTEIYRSSAVSMKSLLLELGGKGAMIVRADADLDAVMEATERTWTYHAGQVCLTTSRLLVDESIHDELVGRLTRRLTSLRHGDPADPATEVVPLISAVQRDRVAALVESARGEGATVHESPGVPARGFFHPATLVTGCKPAHTVMQEEAFGPVLCVMATRSDEHAIEVANSTRYGLSNYVYSRDLDAADHIATRLRSAQVGINSVTRHPDLPFGGLGASGLGRSGGAYALDVYTDLQAIATREGSAS